MAKTIPSPYLAAPPHPTQIRAVGDQPQHCIFSQAEDTALIPFFFVMSGGSLGTQQCSARVWIEELSSGEIRIHHPSVEQEGLVIFLSRDANQSYLIDKSTAPQGYTDVVVGIIDASWEGFFAFQTTSVARQSEIYNVATPPRDTNLARSLAERSQWPVASPVMKLSVAWYSFTVDALGDPVPESCKGTFSFNPEHTGEGEYLLHTTCEFNSSATFIAEVDVRAARALPSNTAGNDIYIETLSGGVPDDPLDGGEVVVLQFHPTSKAGQDFMREQAGMPPVTQHAADGTFPASAMLRDLSFAAIALEIDGSGDVIDDSAATIIPDGIAVTREGDFIHFDIGRTFSELAVAAFHDRGTGGSYPTDYSTLPTDGRVTIDTGGATSTTISGFIAASWTSER